MTDGITETTNGEGAEFGVARVLDAARRQAGGAAEEVLGAIHASARAFAGVEPQKDDMTLVVCKTKAAA
jgi:serine phosphatase RsbU (regulator of sigma subunit)